MKAVNYANQIKEQSNNLVNGLVDNNSNNNSEECCNIFNIETGSYEVIYDYFEDVSLMKNSKILYKLDDYHGKRILINLRKLKIEKEEYKPNKEPFNKFKKQISVQNIDNKHIIFKINDKEIINEEFKAKFEANKSYKLQYFDTDDEDKFIMCDNIKFKAQSNLLYSLDKLLRYDEDENKLYCVYYNESENNQKECEVTIMTGNKNKDYNTVDYNLNIKINGIETTLFGNKIDYIKSKQEGLYIFTHFYIYNKLFIGYDIRSKTYYYIDKQDIKKAKSYIDKDIVEKITTGQDIQTYTYMKKDNKYYCLVLSVSKNRYDKWIKKCDVGDLADNFIKSTLDVTKFGSYYEKDNDNDNDDSNDEDNNSNNNINIHNIDVTQYC